MIELIVKIKADGNKYNINTVRSIKNELIPNEIYAFALLEAKVNDAIAESVKSLEKGVENDVLIKAKAIVEAIYQEVEKANDTDKRADTDG